MHSQGQFTIEDNEKNKTIVILSSSLFPSGKLPGRANVMTSLKMLNNIQVQKPFSATENGMLEALELVALFPLKTETCDAKNC